MLKLRGLELLAPARDAETAREAVLHGADAVYIGGPSHGARAAASNSIADIQSTVDFAHQFGAKVYVTLNTIIYDHELAAVERTIHDLYRIGTDALIVQDMGILRLDIPPIDLHASTQCDIRTVEKAKFLADCGFSQLVLPRELTLDEIKDFRRALPSDVALEAFVHGALCVSYSGDCQAGWAACRRSANRGECAQMCRLPYSLVDDRGNVIIKDKHLLSLRDLNRLPDLQALADAGISSFKIEGRLKDIPYVKTVTAAYSDALNDIIASAPDTYRRTSMGRTDRSFHPDINKAFNRGFTPYFLQQPPNGVKMANFDTPKWVGTKVGTVVNCHGNSINARLCETVNNGDGLGYFSPQGKYQGFRVNRAEGSRLYPASPVRIAPGTVLYRNSDTRTEAVLSAKTATRKIPVDITVSSAPLAEGNISLTISISDDYGHHTQSSAIVEAQKARTHQQPSRLKAFTKLGSTIFSPRTFTDDADPELFVPASTLSTLRRDAFDLFTTSIAATYTYRYRRDEDTAATFATSITYHNNIANHLAAQFYAEHGANPAEMAIETNNKPVADGTTVMTTRYCLRRELGACLKSTGAARLPRNLYLKSANTTYALDFDCANCRMKLKQRFV